MEKEKINTNPELNIITEENIGEIQESEVTKAPEEMRGVDTGADKQEKFLNPDGTFSYSMEDARDAGDAYQDVVGK